MGRRIRSQAAAVNETIAAGGRRGVEALYMQIEVTAVGASTADLVVAWLVSASADAFPLRGRSTLSTLYW
jgi:hypothetical protein